MIELFLTIYIILFCLVFIIGGVLLSNQRKPKDPTNWEWIDENQKRYWKIKK